MKRGRSPVAISIIALCLLLAGLGNQMAFCATVNELDSMTLVAENEYLRLYINEHTTAVAVADKQTDMVWYTNPPNWAKEEGGQRRYQTALDPSWQSLTISLGMSDAPWTTITIALSTGSLTFSLRKRR